MTSPGRRGGVSGAILRLPLPLYFVFLLLVYVIVQVALHAGPLTLVQIVGDAVGGLFFAGVLTALLAARRRRTGGAAQYADYVRAVRTGRVPDGGGDLDAWRPMLERDQRSLRRGRWLGPVVMLLFASLGVFLLVVATTAGERVLDVVLVLLFVTFAIVTHVQSRIRFAHVRTLLDA